MSIEVNKYYTVKEISQLAHQGEFPYVSLNMIFRLIRTEQLKSIRRGVSRKDPYIIKGKWLIEFFETNDYFRETYLEPHPEILKKV